MTDYFTTRFIEDPKAFAALHERLKQYGYVTEDEEPYLNRPTHNSLNEERYQRLFETHNPSQYTDIKASPCAFDVGDGYPNFFVVYDQTQFADANAVKRQLMWKEILK